MTSGVTYGIGNAGDINFHCSAEKINRLGLLE